MYRLIAKTRKQAKHLEPLAKKLAAHEVNSDANCSRNCLNNVPAMIVRSNMNLKPNHPAGSNNRLMT